MLHRISSRIEDVIRQTAIRMGNSWVSCRIRRSNELAFTADYCTWLAPFWSEYLQQFKGREDVRFLEIGSYEGRSAVWFLEHILSHPSSRITCIDIFRTPGSEPRFDHNVRVSGFEHKVTKIKGNSAEILAVFTGAPFDLIYIDGSHRALDVLLDAVTSWAWLKVDGLMLIDDYLWNIEEPALSRPQQGVDLFLDIVSGKVDVLHKDYQVILRRIC